MRLQRWTGSPIARRRENRFRLCAFHVAGGSALRPICLIRINLTEPQGAISPKGPIEPPGSTKPQRFHQEPQGSHRTRVPSSPQGTTGPAEFHPIKPLQSLSYPPSSTKNSDSMFSHMPRKTLRSTGAMCRVRIARSVVLGMFELVSIANQRDEKSCPLSQAEATFDKTSVASSVNAK